MSNLTAWELPESIGWPKRKCKKRQNLTKLYGFHTEKDIKSKNARKKKVFILAKDVITERKIWNQSQKQNRPEKGLLLFHPDSGSWSQISWFFLQNVHLVTKYILTEKVSLFISLQAEFKPPPQPLSFGIRPSLLRAIVKT